ncbi:class II aldolase/adducin family protein [Hydrogenothermus marinus]|uniref:L-fuculose-phosphate aldolase n=1 Tax=Hydrogenothermus marinus TaxID=133270 RepID=A0A3M0C2L1_9AQUI|nr:class II aldolase/adducin family protein [Hydrogenothermus marinus]RMA97182.1 L-fuculose-phosphate aldolase [Hydrogenothermus marinus]
MSIIEEIIFAGKVLYQENLVNSHAGNISVRKGDKIYITKTGAMLGFLKEEDIVEVDIKPSEKDKKASTELIVHRAIYEKTDAKAIVHAHPVNMVALSFKIDKFIPIDSEGKLFIKEVPIIEAKVPSASKEVAEKVSDSLKEYNIVVVKTHGCFIKAENLIKAVNLASDLEYCAKIFRYVRNL